MRTKLHGLPSRYPSRRNRIRLSIALQVPCGLLRENDATNSRGKPTAPAAALEVLSVEGVRDAFPILAFRLQRLHASDD
jgi:hypothetical protein